MSSPDPLIFDAAAFDRAAATTANALALCREALKHGDKALRDRFRAGVPARELVPARATMMDQLLKRVWVRYFGADTEDLALVAVGGYGRAELHPGSDVDVMILVGEDAHRDWREAIHGFLTFLWDIGLEVGHSTRTIADCAREAAADITVATNLMESRQLTGPRALFDQMRAIAGPDHIWPSRAFFEAKCEEQRQRHHKYHDTAYNLEPNVKEGPGGLRDLQMIGWVAKRHFGAHSLQDLVTQGFLTPTEHTQLVEYRDVLWQIRFALHVLTGRREDRLLFDYQRQIAAEFGHRDVDHALAVEQFMQQYYRTIMELSRLNEMLLQLFEEAILLVENPGIPVPINRRFQARKGFLEVTRQNVFLRYPTALLEMFLLLEQNSELKGVRASTIRLVREHRPLIAKTSARVACLWKFCVNLAALPMNCDA